MQNTPLNRCLSALLKPFYGGIGTILMFHRLCPPSPGVRRPEASALEFSPQELEQTILYFRRRDYDFVSLDQVAEILSAPKKRKKFVAFTFDDGYADVFTQGYPIFKKYNVPFTVNLISGFPDGQVILWWYWLEELLKFPSNLAFAVDGQSYAFDLQTLDGKNQAAAAIRRLVKFALPGQQEERIKAIFDSLQQDLYLKTTELALNWQQIRRMASDPLVTIGAHTQHHYVLSKLSEVDAGNEIVQSKLRIEEMIQKEVRHFAYPYGSANEAGQREFDLARKAGFLTATTTRFANLFAGHKENMHALPRLEVPRLGGVNGLDMALSGLATLRRNRLKRLVTL